MTADVAIHGTEVHIDTEVLELPYAAHAYEVVNGVIVISLSSGNTSSIHNQEVEKCSLSIPSDSQNVVALSFDGIHSWTAPRTPHSTSVDEIYQELFFVTDRLLSTHQDGHIYQLSIETGEIMNSWPINRLPISDQEIELDGPVANIIQTDELIIVNIAGVDWPESDTYAFEKDGSLRWRSEETFRNLNLENGTLWAIEPAGGRMWERAPVDLQTGVKGDSEAYEGYTN